MPWGSDPIVTPGDAISPPPAAGGWGKDPVVTKPIDPKGGFEIMDNRAAAGPGAVLDYLKGWGGKVVDAFANPNPHEDLAQVGGAPAGIDAAASLASTFVAPILGPAHALDVRANGAPDYSFQQGMQDRTIDPKTAGGAQLMDAAGALFQPVTDVLHSFGGVAADNAGRLGADSQTQQDVGFLTEATLPAVAGGAGLVRGFRGIPQDIPAGPGGAGAAGGALVQDIRASGYPVAPSLAARAVQRESPRGVMPSVPGSFRESLVNRSELGSRLGTESAKVTERILRDEFGIPEGAPFTRDVLENEARGGNVAYDMVAQAAPVTTYTPAVRGALDQLGATRRNNPNLGALPEVEKLRSRLTSIESAPTQQVLDAIREFRSDARAYFQSPGADPVVSRQLAQAYRTAADALENGIAQQLEATGNTHLFDQFQQARVLQAKINNVLDAWKGAEVDPQALAALGQDVKLTGGLANIAKAATHMPETVYATTGDSIIRPSNASWINTPESGLRRFLFEKWVIPRLLSDQFQNQFGLEAPRSPNARFQAQGPMGDPNVGPTWPPPEGRYPWSPAGDNPEMMSLVPDEGGVPFSETQLPPTGGDGLNLADQAVPDFFRDADTGAADGLSFADPLDEMLGSGVGAERYPFSPTQTDAPGLQPGAASGMADHYGVGPSRPGEMQLGDEFVGPSTPQTETGPGRLWTDPRESDFPASPDGTPFRAPEAPPEPPPGGPLEGEFIKAGDMVDMFDMVDPSIPDAPQNALPGPQGKLPGPRPIGDELTLEPEGPPPSDIRGRYRDREFPANGHVIENPEQTGYLQYEKVSPTEWQIRSAFTREGHRKKGVMQGLVKRLVGDAKREKVTLNSDAKLSEDQVYVYEKLFDSGEVTGEGFDPAAIRAAMDKTGNATNKDGSPWIRNLRPGPNAE